MITYPDILNSIKKCEGGLVTIMVDSNFCNVEFLKFITHELKNEYKIDHDQYDVKNINEKTVIFIDMLKIPRINNSIRNRGILFRDLIGNEKVILIALKNINFSLTPSSLYGGEESYTSNLVLSLKDKKLTVVKTRYTELKYTDSLDISNITTLIRKIKLNKINKK